MRVFWYDDLPGYHEQSREQQYAFAMKQWIVHTWKQLLFPLDRRQLPYLPGIYALNGRFNPCHLKLPLLYHQSDWTVEKGLPAWITKEQKQKEFSAFLYIGSTRHLYSRWQRHQKRLPIEHLFNNGVGIDFYYYTTVPPTETSYLDSKEQKKSREDVEGKLIRYLCPIFGDWQRWGAWCRRW